MRKALSPHVFIALTAVALFAGLHATTGRIETNGGVGYDGVDYMRMLMGQLDDGTPVTELRPMIVLLNRPLYSRLGKPIETFVVMNHVYVFVLAMGLLWLLDRYGASTSVKWYSVLSVFLTIPVARLPAYYPVLIDLGAAAAITLAVACVVRGNRVGAAVACVAAALSREFGIVAALFGLHRDLRSHTPARQIAATYLPAVAAWVGIRLVVEFLWDGAGSLQQSEWLLRNREMWRDPLFVGFFAYFVLTSFGGLTLAIAADGRRFLTFLRREPEWITFAVPIVAVTAIGGLDTVRYLIWLVPAVVVAFAVLSQGWSGVQRAVLFAGAAVATWWTQRPFEPLSFAQYWGDWFPYYVITGEARELPPLQPQWGWRFFAVAAGLWLLTMATQRAVAPLQGRRRPEPLPEPIPARRPEPVSRLFDEKVGV